MSPTLDLGGWLFLAGAWLSITGLTVWCLARVLATRNRWGGQDDPQVGPRADDHPRPEAASEAVSGPASGPGCSG
jgi:hypothetical protein